MKSGQVEIIPIHKSANVGDSGNKPKRGLLNRIKNHLPGASKTKNSESEGYRDLMYIKGYNPIVFIKKRGNIKEAFKIDSIPTIKTSYDLTQKYIKSIGSISEKVSFKIFEFIYQSINIIKSNQNIKMQNLFSNELSLTDAYGYSTILERKYGKDFITKLKEYFPNNSQNSNNSKIEEKYLAIIKELIIEYILEKNTNNNTNKINNTFIRIYYKTLISKAAETVITHDSSRHKANISTRGFLPKTFGASASYSYQQSQNIKSAIIYELQKEDNKKYYIIYFYYNNSLNHHLTIMKK